MEPHIIITIIISLLCSAFFSGIEIAYISASKLHIELKKNQGSRKGELLSRMMMDKPRFLSTALIGNNLALVVYGIMMAKLLEPPIQQYVQHDFAVILIQTIISTGLVLIVGEYVPKAIFKMRADNLLWVLAYPIYSFYYSTKWFSSFVTNISKSFLRKVFKSEVDGYEPVFNKIDLEQFVRQSASQQEEDLEIDATMFRKTLRLTQVKVRECLVPRTDIEAIEERTTIPELMQKFHETGLSKILVFRESIDNIIGYVHHFDLLKRPELIEKILMPIPVVPETMGAQELLNMFKKQQKSIAWVVDEFGGTAGIVTIEDVLEEIFGEIEDEHDQPELMHKKISDEEYLFSGKLEIDFINEYYHLNIPKGDYETIAGYVVVRHESIPKENEVLLIDNYEFTILSLNDPRIETLKMRILSS